MDTLGKIGSFVRATQFIGQSSGQSLVVNSVWFEIRRVLSILHLGFSRQPTASFLGWGAQEIIVYVYVCV